MQESKYRREPINKNNKFVDTIRNKSAEEIWIRYILMMTEGSFRKKAGFLNVNRNKNILLKYHEERGSQRNRSLGIIRLKSITDGDR